MKTVEIIGFKRANLGKSDSSKLRAEGYVPCVIYGGKEQIHFYSPNILFRELVYTPEAYFVELNIEGYKVKAILQDIQFHPVSEAIIHADFLQLFDDKFIKMDVPVRIVGTAPGVQQGGKLMIKLRSIAVKSLPANMPEHIDVDVSGLSLGKSIKVGSVKPENFEIQNSPLVTIATVSVPRAMRGIQGSEEGEEAVAAGESAEAGAEE